MLTSEDLDQEERAREAENKKQEQLREQKEGKNTWKGELASDSEHAVGLSSCLRGGAGGGGWARSEAGVEGVGTIGDGEGCGWMATEMSGKGDGSDGELG